MEFSLPRMKIADTRNEINPDKKVELLTTFEFHSIHPQLIKIHTKEFSAICPGTGLPDIATIDIEYIPKDKCVELKSLKHYFFSYRQDEIFQEPVTDLIFDHLWKTLTPHYLRIEIIYNTRGGFDTTTVVEKGDKEIAKN